MSAAPVVGGRIPPGLVAFCGGPPVRAHYADAYTLTTPVEATPRQWLVACFEDGIPRRDRDLIFRRLAAFSTVADRTPGHVAGWTLIHEDDHGAELGATGPRMAGRLRLDLLPGGRVRLTTVMRYRSWAGRLVWTLCSPFHRAQAPKVLRAGAEILAR